MDARTEFGQLVQQVTSFVGDRDLDAALAADLNDAFGYGSEMHDSLARLIHAGESEGWLLAREAGGIKFGRPVKRVRKPDISVLMSSIWLTSAGRITFMSRAKLA